MINTIRFVSQKLNTKILLVLILKQNAMKYYFTTTEENVVFFKMQFADKGLLLAQMVIICFNQLIFFLNQQMIIKFNK